MAYQRYIEKMIGPSTLGEKLDAARTLASFTDDPKVMNALCETAVTTTSHRLRERLIEALQSNPAGACMRFMDDALWSNIPSRRRWALVNLSLLNCREAKAAVIRGLNDAHASVREAAAMNAGLYDDSDVLGALEHYFESHRLDLTLSFIGAGVRTLRRKAVAPDETDASGGDIGAARSPYRPIGE